MPDYVITTIERDGSEGFSSEMPREKAITFARDMMKDGVRVVRIEAVDGSEILDEKAVKNKCAVRL